MNICYVAPLDTIKKLGVLTYFSNLELENGDLVEIQINKRKLQAIVLHTEPAENAKHELRSGDFQIKKISKVVKKNAISKELFAAMQKASGICGTIISKMFDTMIPKSAIDDLAEIEKNKPSKGEVSEYLIINNEQNILIEIKKIVREEFAKNKSIAVIAPTIIAAENIFESISKGIENKCVIYHSDLSEKNQKKAEESIIKTKNVCIVSTPSLVSFLKQNTETIIITDESSKYYKSFEEELDTRRALATIFIHLNKKIIWTSDVPSMELFSKYKNKKVEIIQKDFVRDEIEKIEVVKLASKKEKTECIYWNKDTENKIKKYVQDGAKVALFSERRGMATTCVCLDCGSVKKCESCNKPYVLHEINGDRIFVCHTCNKKKIIKKDEEILCEYCESWRMQAMGVGVAGIKEYLKNIIDTKIYSIDSDSVKTKKDALKIYKEFDEKGGVLIGTEMILPIIKEIDLVVVVSIDSLFSLPEYNLDEEIFKTIVKLNSSLHKNGEMIVNTRTDEKIFEYIQNKNTEKFLNYELKNREEASLPPYSYLITFDIQKDVNKIPRFLEIFPNYHVNGREMRRNIIMIPKDKWEKDEDLQTQTIVNLLNYNLKINPKNTFKGIL